MKKLFASCEKLGCMVYPAFYVYTRMYKQVVKNEVNLAKISSDDVVLNIGCGAIPFTAVHVAQMTGAKVVAMDRDEEAVIKARRALNKFKLNQNIEIQLGDGSKEIPVYYDAAIVALQVGEKREVLENLKRSARPGASLVFRQPSDKYKQEYGILPDSMKMEKKIEQSMKTFDYSCLYQVPQWS